MVTSRLAHVTCWSASAAVAVWRAASWAASGVRAIDAERAASLAAPLMSMRDPAMRPSATTNRSRRSRSGVTITSSVVTLPRSRSLSTIRGGSWRVRRWSESLRGSGGDGPHGEMEERQDRRRFAGDDDGCRVVVACGGDLSVAELLGTDLGEDGVGFVLSGAGAGAFDPCSGDALLRDGAGNVVRVLPERELHDRHDQEQEEWRGDDEFG